jgi:hypothetical protein
MEHAHATIHRLKCPEWNIMMTDIANVSVVCNCPSILQRSILASALAIPMYFNTEEATRIQNMKQPLRVSLKFSTSSYPKHIDEVRNMKRRKPIASAATAVFADREPKMQTAAATRQKHFRRSAPVCSLYK